MSKKNQTPQILIDELPTASDTKMGTAKATETEAALAPAPAPVAVIPIAPAVADAIARARVGVIPTPRGTHPGSIAFVTMFNLKVRVDPISDLPDHFIYVDGSPVVREEFFSYDANGQPCPSEVLVTAHILRYGVQGQMLQSVRGGDPERMKAAADARAAEKRDKNEAWMKKSLSERKKRTPGE